MTKKKVLLVLIMSFLFLVPAVWAQNFISEKNKEIQRDMTVLQNTHDAVNRMFVLRELPEQVVLSLPDIVNQTTQQVEAAYHSRRIAIQNYDFGSIFKRYIKQL